MVTKIKTQRRRAALLTVLLGSTVALGACGLNQGTTEGTAEGGDLSMWHQISGKGAEAMSDIVDDFNEVNPDMQFTDRSIANDEANTVVRTGLSSNNPPTVVQYEGYQQTQDFVAAGQLLDITDWWEENKGNFTYGDSEAVKDACEVDGKMYCIPWNVDTSAQLFYNPGLVEELGLEFPESIQELKDLAGKLESSDVNAVSLYAGDGWPAAHWWYLLAIQRCGVDKILAAAEQDGAQWDEACFEQSAQDLYDLGEAGVFPVGVAGQDYNSMLQLFLTGKAAFMNTGTWFNSTLEEDPPAFEPSAIQFPQVDPENPSDQILGGFTNVIGVTANSGNTEAGMALLSHFADPETGAGDQFAASGFVNVVVGADEHMNERVKASYDAIAEALALPGNNVIAYFENLVPPTVGEDVMYNGTASLAAGTMTPEDYVADLQAAAAAAAD